MADESLLNTNWNSGDTITASALNAHGQAHLDLDGHGDAFHSVQYLKSLTGGNGIDPNNIGDGDTLSLNLSDIAGDNLTVDTTNNELDATGSSGITSLSGGDGIDPNNIGDGDTLSAAWGDAVDLDADGSILADTIDTAELNVRPFTYDPGMTEWEDNLSAEEVNRMVLQSDEFLTVERIEFRQKGGGSSSVASLQVRDDAAGSNIGSADLGSTVRNPGFSQSGGTTIIIRVSNNTGGTINAAPRVLGYISGI